MEAASVPAELAENTVAVEGQQVVPCDDLPDPTRFAEGSTYYGWVIRDGSWVLRNYERPDPTQPPLECTWGNDVGECTWGNSDN